MEEGTWASLLPELLAEIVRRVEAGGERWPERKDLVACAGVCRRWREAVKAITLPPHENGWITFPSSLKEPGPRDPPIQCFIRRNKKYSTFYLYLGLTQSLTDNGKFLLAARQIRHGTHTDYIISLDADDLTQESKAYMGKLRSNLLGTTFKIYDNKPPYSGAKMSNGGAIRRATSKQVSPPVPRGDFEIGIVSYILNLRKRGPRRMHCLLQCASSRDTAEEESSKPKAGAPVPLRNKDPRWHERLQCWCLNFHGRVTMASVKNFQLVATAGGSHALAVGGETVLLQFGKVGDDVFTMDYRRPLSAFQAFAICLSSFGAKFACK